MTKTFFGKSYLNVCSRPLMDSAGGLSSDTFGLSDSEDNEGAAQYTYEIEEGSKHSRETFNTIDSIAIKIKERRWRDRSMLRAMSERKSHKDDDSRLSGKSSNSWISLPRNSFRFPSPFPVPPTPSSVWMVNHVSRSAGFISSESSNGDGSPPTLYPSSLPKESAGLPYSARSAIGDGSSRQQDSKYIVESRALRPNGSHLDASFWSDSGERSYMEDRFLIDHVGVMSTSCPIVMPTTPQAATAASSPHGIADFARDHVFDKKSVYTSGTPATMFSVFDGHGGPKASQYCCDWMSSYVRNDLSFPHDLETAMRSAYHAIDEDFVGTGEKDGSTACACIVVGRERITCANAGDSRAIVVRRDGSVAPLSRDHKPSVPDETRRITSLGGSVTYAGRWRIEGSLAVSRGIGDTALKPYVTAEPEICEMDIGDDDLFLVIASDGIFDVLDNERVAQIVISGACRKESKRMKKTNSEKLRGMAQKLCDKAKKSGSFDNLCAIVVDLHSSDRRSS